MPDYVLLHFEDKVVGTGKYFRAGSSEPSRTLHGLPLSRYARDGEDLVVIYHVQIFSEYLELLYPYRFGGSEEPPRSLGDLNTVGKHFKSLIAWDNAQLLPHNVGCELGDWPRSVSEKHLLFSNNIPGEVHLLNHVHAHEAVNGSGDNICITKETIFRQTVAREDKLDLKNAGSAGNSVTRRGRADEEPVANRSRRFSRIRSHLKRDTVRFDRTSARFESEGFRNVDSNSESFLSNDGPEFEDGIFEDRATPSIARNCRKKLSVEDLQPSESDEMESDGSETDEDEECISDKIIEEKDCRHLLPLPKKRAYVYHTRKRGIPTGPSELRKRRKTMAQRVDNPFLRKGLHCCKAFQCFSNIDPVYAFKIYKEVMTMNREDFKAFLIGLFSHEHRCFMLQGKKVCSRYLQKGYGFSNDLQSSVKNTPCARAGPTAKALPRDVIRVTKKECIINFLHTYADECGDMMPHALFTNLPDRARKEVYEKFREHFRKHYPNETPPSIAFFYSVWKSECRNIRTRRNHGFSKCEVCIFLKAEIAENQRHSSVARRAAEAFDRHMDMVKEERRFYHNRCERAIRHPRKYISLVVDGADQKSFGLPHFSEKSKADRGHKLKVKCVGVLEHRSDKKLSLYAMTEEFLTGTNHVIEVVHRTLTTRKCEGGKLPEVLYVQVDNCTRENKNRYFLSYLEMLVALGVFLEVEVSFLPIGHTHADIDQAFSSVSKPLKRFDAATLGELVALLGLCYAEKATGIQLDKVANYSGLCENTKCLVSARSLRGFTDFRYFRFTKATGTLPDGAKFRTQCHVKVQCSDEWQDLSLGPKKGCFKFIPDLNFTPPTETFPPDNVVEVNHCLVSLHNRNRKAALRIIPELERLRDKVYTKRSDPFHWSLIDCVELNGNYLSDEDDDAQSWSDEEGDQDANNSVEFEAETFVAIKPQGNARSRFWIAMVLQVVDRSSSNKARWLQVLW